jgi:hypothetical protein
MTTSAPQFIFGAAPPDFWWTVRVPVPTEDDYAHAELPVQFAQLPQTELDKMRGLGLADGEAAPSDEQIALRVLRGWRLHDEAGQAVPFGPEALAQLLAAPLVRSAIVATYLACMNGMAARKNA